MLEDEDYTSLKYLAIMVVIPAVLMIGLTFYSIYISESNLSVCISQGYEWIEGSCKPPVAASK